MGSAIITYSDLDGELTDVESTLQGCQVLLWNLANKLWFLFLNIHWILQHVVYTMYMYAHNDITHTYTDHSIHTLAVVQN